ncbi:MAG: leucine-rich repeat protein [Brevinematales bacterium]|nr:leucine-rich repeat protein [Brevinematales bacterium]
MKIVQHLLWVLILPALMVVTGCEVAPTASETFIVDFDSLGGTHVSAQVVSDGGKAIEPNPPSKSDSTFGGWFKDVTFIDPWVFTADTVTANMTLYAKWDGASSEYYVIFDSLGGSGVGAQKIATGSYVAEPDFPYKDGYVFTGWYKEETCVNPWRFTEDQVSSLTVLYAKWLVSPFTFITNVGIRITACSKAFSGVLNIPNTINGIPVTEIGSGAFDECSNITSIFIPDSVTNFVGFTFTFCSGLTNIKLPNNFKRIALGMFGGCTGLTTINIPDSVLRIDPNAFEDCGLISISIPANITNIGQQAFLNCTALTTVNMYPSAAPTLGSSVFSGVAGCTLHLKSGATGYDVSPWTDAGIFSTVQNDL